MRTERMCNNSGNMMSVNTDDMCTCALQGIRLNSFCTHEILGTLAYQSDVTGARYDVCVIALKAMSVG